MVVHKVYEAAALIAWGWCLVQPPDLLGCKLILISGGSCAFPSALPNAFRQGHRTVEWLGLEGPLKIIQFQPSCHRQGLLPHCSAHGHSSFRFWSDILLQILFN